MKKPIRRYASGGTVHAPSRTSDDFTSRLTRSRPDTPNIDPKMERQPSAKTSDLDQTDLTSDENQPQQHRKGGKVTRVVKRKAKR